MTAVDSPGILPGPGEAAPRVPLAHVTQLVRPTGAQVVTWCQHFSFSQFECYFTKYGHRPIWPELLGKLSVKCITLTLLYYAEKVGDTES